MTKFITVQDDVQKEKKETVFEFVYSCNSGWIVPTMKPTDQDKVLYLGRCASDGDMFACYKEDKIRIYKGIKGDEFND